MLESLVMLAVGIAIGVVFTLLRVAIWKRGFRERERSDAIRQSKAVVTGQVYEQLVPYLPEFKFNPRDAHFLGKPVDFIVFDGLSDNDLRRVVLVEIKTGSAGLTARERSVRDAVRSGKVEWAEIRMAPSTPSLPGAKPAVRSR
jgi:predicted Holliday junction resolvase-like endonuclease